MTSTERTTSQKVSILTLIGIVVGSMVGGGVFTLPRSFGSATGVLGAIIAWVIAGTGMLMLAFVFQSLALRRPDLDSGVYIYAKTGFGNYAGFNAAFGYWASNIAGNVFFLVFTMTTLGTFFRGWEKATRFWLLHWLPACVWFFHYLIAWGVRQAAAVNRIVTVAKLVPIVVFIFVVGFAFDPQTFSANFWGGETRSVKSIFDQVTDTMLITTFVFLGVEGASVYSRFARRREDVGRATVLGFLSVLAIFASVTMVSYGVLPRQDLANTHPPLNGRGSESVVGSWGSTFISIGVIISVQGAYLAWTLINAEVLYMARTAVMPKFLARNNKNNTPIAALITTNVAVQVATHRAFRTRRTGLHDRAGHGPLWSPISSLRDTPSSSRSPGRPTGRPTSRNAAASRSSQSRPRCIRSSCCTPRGSNISWPASSTPLAPSSTSGPDGTGRARFPAARGRAVRSACGRCRRRNRPHLHRLPGTLILD